VAKAKVGGVPRVYARLSLQSCASKRIPRTGACLVVYSANSICSSDDNKSSTSTSLFKNPSRQCELHHETFYELQGCAGRHNIAYIKILRELHLKTEQEKIEELKKYWSSVKRRVGKDSFCGF
jgi:hypothetical protein